MLARLPWSPVESKEPTRRLPKDRRRRLTNTVAAILQDGETPFTFEGATRAGLRSRLCLDGWQWSRADYEAAEIVAAALRRLGAKRPTWEQGQHQLIDELVERTRCVRCGDALPPPSEHHHNGISRKFCSGLCGQLASQERARQSGERRSHAEYLAACAARTEKTRQERTRPCERCGELFTPARSGQRFCNKACADAATGELRRLPEQPCIGCGRPFKPKTLSRKYCSAECYRLQLASPKQHRGVERQCPVCRGLFTVHSKALKQITCSRRCALDARWARARVAANAA